MKNKKTPFWALLLSGMILITSGFVLGRHTKEISAETIAWAEQIIGLSFSPPERDSMKSLLQDQKVNYASMRKQPLVNATGPSLYFNPLPHGFHPNQNQEPINWGLPGKIDLPSEDKDIAFMTVAELSTLIRNQKISSEKLTQIYLERIKTHSDTLECLISLLEEEALSKARQMDEEIKQGKYRGPLHGIPYGIKDLFSVKSTKTTWGAMPYKDQEIDETATVVNKLDDAGAVLVAKFTLGALAMGDIWYGGKTRNPWNLEQGSSGSSAGSAAAVSAGLVPFALGTETYGSIVSPSTRNGVTGLRPTFGRVSRSGAMALSWSMDKIGPISRSALDNGIVLSVINGVDKKDKSTIPAAFNYNVDKSAKELKIGYFSEFFKTKKPNRDNENEVLDVLRAQGFQLKSIALETQLDVNSMILMLMAEGAAAFDSLTRSGDDDLLVAQHKNAWPNLFRAARFIPAVEYIQASRFRAQLIEEMHALFKDYDVIITPSFGGNQLLITNLTGHPALCMPNGFNDQGSPTSITFLANLYEEEKLIMLGRLYQEGTSWDEKRPPLFDK
ncbi:amidase [Echinicola sp. CAU 1574]|uniref:Amidase n=1 Tax=Echinicola arenosa TaxID=2774144 RepID=A0ABR9AM58_9BACT|nr:amidase [Echinicola arenosa]MBD8488928.1 amidase [Echinicola arenosa]